LSPTVSIQSLSFCCNAAICRTAASKALATIDQVTYID
jgi:hypothetical protein